MSIPQPTEMKRITRFLVFGTLAAAVNWLIRFPLSEIMPFEVAVLVAYMAGMSAGFTLYRAFVFPGSSQPVAVQLRLFLSVNAVGAILVWSVTMGLVNLAFPALGMEFSPEAIGHGIAIGIGAIVSYFGHKYLTFSQGNAKHIQATM